MKTWVKYSAIACALFLAVSIIGSCLVAGIVVARSLNDAFGENGLSKESFVNFDGEVFKSIQEGLAKIGIQIGDSGEKKTGEYSLNEATNAIYVEGFSGTLTITRGQRYSVVYRNIPEDYKIYEENGALYLKGANKMGIFLFTNSYEQSIEITVPTGVYLRLLDLDTGSGTTTISKIQADKIILDSGSGSCVFQEVACEKLDIDSGSGACKMTEMVCTDLLVDSGSGSVSYQGELFGNGDFDTGSGSVKLDITGAESNYNIYASLGSGGMYINGKREKDTKITYKSADSNLKFSTGSGRVSINFTGE